MTNKKLIKRVAPIVMSVAVAMTSMPMTALAEDFTDGEVVAVEETAETAEAAETEASDGEAAEEESFDAEAEEESAEDADFAAETTEETTEETAEETAAEEDVNAVSFDSGEDGIDFSAEDTSEYHYVYAGLSWTDYWSGEDVYNGSNAKSSNVLDAHNEYDKGGFDAVTRATTNHGMYRASFQTITVITTKSGKTYQLAKWEDAGKTMVFADGTKAAWERPIMTFSDGSTEEFDHYTVSGWKYVPVKVKTSDYADFIKTYSVVENGEKIFGGSTNEGNVKAYEEIANVTENTNGLKTAVKNSDGSFSFTARKTGTDSGIKDAALKTVENISPLVLKDTKVGSFGEFLRVDFSGDGYGDLGAKMQAVTWTYYGNDSTYSKALRTYGTKFIGDNWMHSKNGIQLGLTDSIRCQLPEGYDGTGYWSVTISALGYQDYTYKFQAASENIYKPSTEEVDTSALTALIEKAELLKEEDYTADTWSAFTMEFEESKELLANGIYNKSGINEQTEHLSAAIEGLKKVERLSISKTSATIYTGKTVTLSLTTNIEGTPTWKSSSTSVATVDAKGKVTAKKAGTATITATLGSKSVTCKVTVKAASISVKASASTIYTAGQKTATIKVTKNGVSGTAKYTSSKTSVATVNSKGVVTAKKAGTTTITVTVGSLKKTVKITVKKPSLTLTKSSATLKKGKTTTIKYKAAPSGKATFKSSNSKVASVSSTGKVTAKKAGTAKITVKVNGVSKTFKVTVK